MAKGDRVALYLPMVRAGVAVLACARIGAVHSVVFAGFSARSLADRIQDAGAVCVITSDGMKRGAKGLGLKAVVDQALAECPTVNTNLVVRHTGEDVDWTEGRDVWLHDALTTASADCHRSEWPQDLAILYLRQHGQAQGVVHTCGATWSMRGTASSTSSSTSPATCTGAPPTSAGSPATATSSTDRCSTVPTVMFEGVPTWPPARFWEVCEKLKVNQFYTARPSAP